MSLSKAQQKLHKSIGKLSAAVGEDEKGTRPEGEGAERWGRRFALARARARASLRLRVKDVERRHKAILAALASPALSRVVRAELQHVSERRRRWLRAAYLLGGWMKTLGFSACSPLSKGDDDYDTAMGILYVLPGAGMLLAAEESGPFCVSDDDVLGKAESTHEESSDLALAEEDE